MSAVKKLEKAITELKTHELIQFREWFEEFDSGLWDKQFESDAKSGKLDNLAKEAIIEYKKGDFKKI